MLLRYDPKSGFWLPPGKERSDAIPTTPPLVGGLASGGLRCKPH